MSYGEEELAVVDTDETTIIHKKDLISFVHQQYSSIHSFNSYLLLSTIYKPLNRAVKKLGKNILAFMELGL